MANAYKHKIYSVADWNDKDALLKDYKRLAKVADQRLVRIEGYRHDVGFENVDKFAYARAIKDIQHYSGLGSNRFNTKAPDNIKTLKAKINDILKFLNSPTSTKQGIIQVYKKRVNTLNEKYGTNFTWQDFADFIQSDKYNELASKADSATIMLNIGKMQKDNKKIVAEIQKSKGKTSRVSSSEVNDWIYDALEKNGINPFE